MLLCSVLATAGFAVAEILDVPGLRVAALALVAGVFIAREIWTWRGEGRSFLVMVGLLLAVIVVAFVIEWAT